MGDGLAHGGTAPPQGTKLLSSHAPQHDLTMRVHHSVKLEIKVLDSGELLGLHHGLGLLVHLCLLILVLPQRVNILVFKFKSHRNGGEMRAMLA